MSLNRLARQGEIVAPLGQNAGCQTMISGRAAERPAQQPPARRDRIVHDAGGWVAGAQRPHWGLQPEAAIDLPGRFVAVCSAADCRAHVPWSLRHVGKNRRSWTFWRSQAGLVRYATIDT